MFFFVLDIQSNPENAGIKSKALIFMNLRDKVTTIEN